MRSPNFTKSTPEVVLPPLADLHAPPAPPAPLTPREGWAQWLLDGFGWDVLRPLVDSIALVAAVAAAASWGGDGLNGMGSLPLLAFPALAMAALVARRTYQRRMREVLLDGLVPVVGALSMAAMVALVLQVYVADAALEAPLLARAYVFALALVGAGRMGCALAQRHARTSLRTGHPTLVVGAGQVGARVARRLAEAPEYGLRPVGFLDADPPAAVEVGGRPAPVLGDASDLARAVAITEAQHVVLAFSTEPDRALLPLVRRCEALGVEVSLVPRLFESMNDRVAYEPLGGLPLLGLRFTDPAGWQFRIKHGFDRAVALGLLVLLAPVLLAVAVAVRASSPGPVLFRQRRVGRDGQVFDLLKFRTMRVDAPPAAFHPDAGQAPGGVEGDDRRTSIGRFLRRSSLDELPQLLNVLRGQMSLVGPRPERPEFVELFTADLDRYADRHRVRSGITGWAQVHGLRGQTSLADRVEWDNYYIEHWSLGLDLKILALTFLAVFRAAE